MRRYAPRRRGLAGGDRQRHRDRRSRHHRPGTAGPAGAVPHSIAGGRGEGPGRTIHGNHRERAGGAGTLRRAVHRRLHRAGARRRGRVPGRPDTRAAPGLDLPGRGSRVAEVDEPALLPPAGRELRGDERAAAGGGVRARRGRPQRQGADADARHHEAQRNARRAERQRLRAIRRVEIPHHGDGPAVRHRTVGLAARRPPRHRQLLRPGRSGGDDAVLRGLGAGDGAVRQVHRACRSCRTNRTRAWPS